MDNERMLKGQFRIAQALAQGQQMQMDMIEEGNRLQEANLSAQNEILNRMSREEMEREFQKNLRNIVFHTREAWSTLIEKNNKLANAYLAMYAYPTLKSYIELIMGKMDQIPDKEYAKQWLKELKPLEESAESDLHLLEGSVFEEYDKLNKELDAEIQDRKKDVKVVYSESYDNLNTERNSMKMELPYFNFLATLMISGGALLVSLIVLAIVTSGFRSDPPIGTFSLIFSVSIFAYLSMNNAKYAKLLDLDRQIKIEKDKSFREYDLKLKELKESISNQEKYTRIKEIKKQVEPFLEMRSGLEKAYLSLRNV